MDYNRVAVFVRVVRAGSFTAAGRELNATKSSISRSVSQLERELGVRLLQRTTRKLNLTEAGRAYYDTVAGAVEEIDEADRAARELGAEPRGRVRLTAPPGIAEADLAREFAEFSRKYPAIQVELTLTSRTIDLVAEGFDLAVRAGRLTDSSLVARRIGETEAAVFAAPSYLRRRGRPRAPADLTAHEWVLYRAREGKQSLTLHNDRGAEQTVLVRGALSADELSFCLAAMEAGAGLAMLPVQSAIKALSAGRAEQVLPGWTQRGNALYVVMPSAEQLPVRVALVRDFLVEHLTRKLRESASQCEKKSKRP